MKASWLRHEWPWGPMRPHQRQRMVHSRAMHPSTITVLLPQLEADARPDCWCGQPAELLVLRHAIDSCLEDDLSEDGAEIVLSCVGCVSKMAAAVAADLERRYALVPQGEFLRCLTCGREISSFHNAMEFEKL